jgi:hypothetical protein
MPIPVSAIEITNSPRRFAVKKALVAVNAKHRAETSAADREPQRSDGVSGSGRA